MEVEEECEDVVGMKGMSVARLHLRTQARTGVRRDGDGEGVGVRVSVREGKVVRECLGVGGRRKRREDRRCCCTCKVC